MAEGTLTIKFLGDPSKLKSDFDNLGTAAGTFEGKIEGAGSKFGNFATIASGIVAAGALQKIGGFLKDGATGAMEDAAAMDRLKTAVENTGVAFGTRSQAIDDAIKKGQELAFSDGDIMSALTNLTNATGDSDEALRRLTLAQDLARGTGMSLEQASKLLGKTSDENTATLARYGIQLDKNATAQDVMNEVDKRFGGQAAAFADSDAGKWAQLQLQMTELQETIGGMLIPVFAVLATTLAGVFSALEPVTSFLSEHMPEVGIALGAVAAVITGALVPALIAWAFTSEAAVVPALIATTVAAAPLILLAAAIAAAAVALYVAWEHNFLGIQDITQQVIDFVRPYIEQALAAIQAVFETVLPVLTAVFNTAWSAIQAVVETVLPIVQTVIETYLAVYVAIITTALGVIQAIFETVFPIIQAVVETVLPIIAAVVETYVNAILTVVQTVLPLVLGVFQLVWDGIKLYVETVLAAIGLIVQVGMYLIKDIVGPILGALQAEVWDPIWDAMKATIDTLLGAGGSIVTAVSTGMGLVQSAVETVLGGIETIWNETWGRLASAANTILGGVKAAWNAIAGTINAGLGVAESVINTMIDAYNKLPIGDIGHVSISGWLPTFGGSSGAGVPQSTTQLPSGGTTTGGGQKPVPVTPDLGSALSNAYINPASMGNLSGGSVGNSGTAKVSIAPADMGALASTIAGAVEAAVERGIRRALAGAI